ncbi:MAG: GNAT family N-acetyltransferase [Clostridium sp.]|uniref:aminoglycoside 6'-N-acetyltransferase n=1 Tax=Clostridium sp. TaxID=1506 RepID=UPI00306F1EB8
MIKQAVMDDSKAVAELAILLWPDNETDDLEREMKEYINKGAIFICFDENRAVGFAQCNLRSDYVEGTESSPVGYLEGIFVRIEYRKRGIAKKLLNQCEYWAKGQGCSEFASDCELNNTDSLKFHLQLGFEETNRIICFKKKL